MQKMKKQRYNLQQNLQRFKHVADRFPSNMGSAHDVSFLDPNADALHESADYKLFLERALRKTSPSYPTPASANTKCCKSERTCKWRKAKANCTNNLIG